MNNERQGWIETILPVLTDDFERPLFRGALDNLTAGGGPLRFNNFAYAVRELVRHVLARLAPDQQVLQCSWYRDETGKIGGISRRQRACYAVQGGLEDEYVNDVLELEPAAMHRALVDAIGVLNKYTHIQPETFGKSDAEVDHLADETLAAVANLFETITECRSRILRALWDRLDDEIVNAALRETIVSIDELATHHYIDEVYVDEIKVIGIDSSWITFEAIGSISVELQWGSNSDLKNDMGAIGDESFPFSCRLTSPIDNPKDVEADDDTLAVDTSGWSGNDYDE